MVGGSAVTQTTFLCLCYYFFMSCICDVIFVIFLMCSGGFYQTAVFAVFWDKVELITLGSGGQWSRSQRD